MLSSAKFTGRLVPFGAVALLGACVWQSDYDALQARYDSVVAQNNALTAQNQQLQAQNQQIQGNVARLQNAVKYTVNSDLLFPSGSWTISAAGRETMAKLASQLSSTQQNKLVVNGYTDNAPIGRGLQQQGITSNEMLSQKRAEAVVDYLVSRGFNAGLLSAKGYGEMQPVATNDTAAGRSQNRRVEIALAPSG